MRAKLVKGTLYTLAALFLLIALLVWIAGREFTLRYAFERLAMRSNGVLSVEGLRGGLYEGMSFDKFVIKLPTQTITLEDGSILWEAMAFTGKTLLARHARVGKVTVETTRVSTERAKEPKDLLLPIQLIIPSLEVNDIELIDSTGKQTPVTRLAPLKLTLQHRGGQWQIDNLSLATPWGQVAGHLNLGAVKPFPVAGTAGIDQKAGDTPYRADVKLEGVLSDLRLSGSFAAKGMPGTAIARLAPFAEQPLMQATVDVPHFLPRKWNAEWPEADLAVRALLAPDGKTNFRGDARLVNNLPGTLDAKRVPVVSVTSKFQGNLQSMRLDDVVVALAGGGGTLSGQGQVQDMKPTFAFTAREVNLNSLHTKLRATKIGGDIKVAQSGEAVQLNVALTEARLALRADAAVDAKNVLVRSAELSTGKGRVTFAGNLALQGNKAFSVKGEAASFNPAEFGDYPAGDLNASVQAEGTLSPSWRVVAGAVLKPSQLMGKPLSGTLRATATPDALTGVDANILFATNRITAKGGMSGKDAAASALAWELDLRRLADFDARLGGQLLAKGTLAGTFSAPRGEFNAEAIELRYQETHRVRSLVAKGSIANATSLDAARIDLQATLTEYRTEGFRLERAALQLAGTRGAHTARLTAANRQIDALVEARGGLNARNEWKGDVVKLENKGGIPIASRAAFALAASPGGVEIGRAAIDVSGGRVEMEQLRIGANEISAKGRAQSLPLALVNLFNDGFRRQVNTTARLSAEWNLVLGNTASGTLRIVRDSGDLEFRTEPRLPLGLGQFELSAAIADNRINAKLDANGARLGTVRATASTRLTKRGRTWGISGDAPLEGTADIDVASLEWVARFTGQADLELNGRLRANLTAAGTVSAPRLTGSAQGSALTLNWPAQGVKFRDGVLEARFDDNSVTVQRFRVFSGQGAPQNDVPQSGVAEAEGTLRYAGGKPGGRINITLKEFEAVSRPDRLVVASGTGSLEFDDKRLTVKAHLKADRGLIDLPEKSGPTTSDDIVIIGGSRPTRTEAAEQKMLTRLDLHLDLGQRFRIKGGGIDGELEGVLNVTSTDGGLPRALGTLRVVDGTYLVYGQKLTIERGIITFSGPIDNPGLNILALRKGLQVEAGVEVRGSAIAPQAKLVSTPNVPETDKLSWLILGRGLDASTQGDFSLLSAAASGLLGSDRATSVQARLANALGVDEFGISAPSGSQGGLLTVGKRLSSRLYLTYEQGLGHVSNLLKIRYVLSRRWSVQAQTGTDNAADVFYTFSFD